MMSGIVFSPMTKYLVALGLFRSLVW